MRNKTIAILTYGKDKPLGDFSKGYIEDLPFKKVVLFGGLIPFLTLGTPIWKQKLIRYFFTILALNNLDKIEKLKARRLEYLLKKYNVDCGLAEFLNTGASVYPIFKKNNIPLISNVLGYEINDTRFYNRFKEKYKGLANFQSFTVPVAKDMIPKLLDLGFEENSIVYSPIGPSNNFFEIKPDYKSDQFVFIGRMTETKSPQTLIRAFKQVVEKYPKATLIMAGDGELMDDVKNKINELNLTSNIKLLGWISKEQQVELYNTSFCYVQHSVMSSTGDKEGTPVSILEASAAGLPIISTIHAGIPDVILDKETGLLVEEFDVDGMAVNMILLFENRNLVEEYGRKGKLFIKENFSLTNHLKVMEDLINKSIDK